MEFHEVHRIIRAAILNAGIVLPRTGGGELSAFDDLVVDIMKALDDADFAVERKNT